jgi:hypothetical protein
VSGETEKDVSGWTVDTLHSYMEQMFALVREQIERQWSEERRATDIALRAHDEALKVAAATSKEAVNAALDAQKEAVRVEQVSANQRADNMNKWRESLNDILARTMGRTEAEAAISRATERIHELSLGQQNMVTRTEYQAARQHDTERMNEQATRITEAESLARGAKDNRAAIFAYITVIGVVVSIVVALVTRMG